MMVIQPAMKERDRRDFGSVMSRERREKMTAERKKEGEPTKEMKIQKFMQNFLCLSQILALFFT